MLYRWLQRFYSVSFQVLPTMKHSIDFNLTKSIIGINRSFLEYFRAIVCWLPSEYQFSKFFLDIHTYKRIKRFSKLLFMIDLTFFLIFLMLRNFVKKRHYGTLIYRGHASSNTNSKKVLKILRWCVFYHFLPFHHLHI